MKLLVCALLVAFAALLPAPLYAQIQHTPNPFYEVGVVTHIQGDVRLLRHGDAERPLRHDDRIHLRDRIVTRGNSGAHIHFADHSLVKLGPLGALDIDEYVYNPERPDSNKVRLRLIDAPFEYSSGLIAKENHPDIRLDLDFGSVKLRRGKILRAMLNKRSWVYVENGEADVFNDHATVTQNSGQGTRMSDPGTSPFGPRYFHWSQIDRLRAAVGTH